MARKNKSPAIYALALLLFIGGVSFIAWSGISQNKTYFLNVSEALEIPAGELRSARLFGIVADSQMIRHDNQLGVRFILQDIDYPGRTVVVDYSGIVPDTFEPGAEVIVEGGMREDLFLAKTLMTKCPSKYEKDNRTVAARS